MSNTGAWAETGIKAVIVRKYYYLAGQRAVRPAQRSGDGIAMRASGVVYWLHADHLGSTSLTMV